VSADGRPTVLVDGNNVMGAGARGWWRDPAAAARTLIDRLRCYAAATGAVVEVVFDVALPDLPEGEHCGVLVRYATRRGRDAGDDRIRELLDAGGDGPVEVITSDRALATSARRRGAGVTGAGSFLARLADAGC
jgi:predicted RNA-binding protein with PIN domain